MYRSIIEAKAHLARAAEEFFALPEIARISLPGRLDDVFKQIDADGTYDQTYGELLEGAKLAWRNHARCLGRFHWPSLRLIDARGARTGEEIAEYCWRHLRESTNGGKIRPVVTVFAPQRPGAPGLSIRNPQLIRYAGHRQEDGSVVGDPTHVELTDQAREMGWTGTGGSFDVLPLIIDLPDGGVHMADVPADCILEVPIEHPEYPFVAELGLRWHANPAISSTIMEIGGLNYTAAPFTGWYVSTEIGARNFCDTNRYDVLPRMALGMGLDMSKNRHLWRDRALIEMNRAVLHSYQQAGVTMVDHHTAAEQFIKHVERESADGRGVPADWAWVNPPMSGSLTPTYHRDYDPPDFERRPNFVQRSPGCPVAHG